MSFRISLTTVLDYYKKINYPHYKTFSINLKINIFMSQIPEFKLNGDC
jgi:hypothetical protein